MNIHFQTKNLDELVSYRYRNTHRRNSKDEIKIEYSEKKEILNAEIRTYLIWIDLKLVQMRHINCV